MQYDYSWGDECVISARVTVVKHKSNYTMTFHQAVYDIENFYNLVLRGGIKVISSETSDYHLKFFHRNIIMVVEAPLNSKPHKLFHIDDRHGNKQ